MNTTTIAARTPWAELLHGPYDWAICLTVRGRDLFAFDEATLWAELALFPHDSRVQVAVRAPYNVERGAATLIFTPEGMLRELSATRACIGLAAWYNAEKATP